MVDKALTFFLRFLAIFLQFFIIAILSNKSDADIFGFYFLSTAIFQIISYFLTFGFERIAFINISKYEGSSLIDIFSKTYLLYLKTLKKHFYIFIIALLINIYFLDVSIILNLIFLLSCFVFSLNQINSQSILGSNSPNFGVFFGRVFYLAILSIIFLLINIFEIQFSYALIILGLFLSSIISLILSFIFIIQKFSHSNVEKNDLQINFSFDQYKIQLLNITFQRLPILLLNIFFNDKLLIAVFSLIHSFVTIRGTILDILTAQYGPTFIKMYSNMINKKEIIRFFRRIQFNSFVINTIYVIFVILFGNQILSFFSNEFVSFNNLLSIYVFGNIILSIFGLSIFLDSIVNVKNSSHIRFIFIAISTLLIVSTVLVNEFQIYGLVIAIFLSWLLLNVLSYKNILKELK